MKISIQSGCSVNEFGVAKAYEMYREAGFEAIDWNIDMALDRKALMAGTYLGKSIFESSLEDILAYYEEELCEMKKNGLTVTQAHAPFPAYVTDKPEVLDYMIGIYHKCIALCDHLQIKNLIIHGISLAKDDTVNTVADIEALNRKLYTSLIPALQKANGVTVCLENLLTQYENIKHQKMWFTGHCSDAQAAATFIDELNEMAGKECFGLCFDTGHLQLLKQDMRVYLPVLGKRIKALHIHDNDGADDLHMAPYTGTIVWKDFYTTLAEIGYTGDLSFETFRQTTVNNIDAEMVFPWLKLIASCGAFFRSKIQK